MLVATIFDKKTGQNSYIYTNDTDNGMQLKGYKYSNEGLKAINFSEISELFRVLKISKNSKYLCDYLGYKIYLDKESGLKHYFKDGKEDYIAFIKFNGKSHINCSKEEQKDKDTNVELDNNTNNFFQLTINSKSFIISTALFLVLFYSAQLCSGVIDTLQTRGYIGYDEIGHYQFNDKIDTYEEAKDLIYSSENLTEDEAKYLCNEDLFKDVLPYYNSSNQYFLNSKLSNLQYQYFEGEKYNDGHPILAYYDRLKPNVITGKEGEDKNKYSGHEFFHLLQAPLKYEYIGEASADIASFEYNREIYMGYPTQATIIRMLMDVIGPKIIWEYNLTGNEEELKKIFKENLTKEEYEDILEILSDVHSNRDDELIVLIGNLYRNMYNSEIINNPNIFGVDGNFIDGRYYFNESKMPEQEEYRVLLNDYYSDKNELVYAIYLTNDQYEKFKVENPFAVDSLTTDAYVSVKNGVVSAYKFSDNIKVEYSSGEKIILPESIAIPNECVDGKVVYISEGLFNICTFSDVSLIRHFYVPSIILNGEYEYELEGNMLVVKVNNIKDRFPDQRVRVEDNQTLKREYE